MFNNESYKEPFWAKSGDFIRGRDPLGIQNSSISVYSKLLPGMTNLTLRIRYYGFYIWLLDQYHQLPENNNLKQDVNGQYTFVRRAELIVAFLMGIKHNEQQSIIGSNYVAKYTEEFTKEENYNIAKGADDLNGTSDHELYWGFKSGALGQYYAGSLIALGLVEVKGDGYFFRTENKGVLLAKAVNLSISENSKTLLLKRIQEGKLYTNDLDVLEDFSISKNLEGTAECDFYINMLFEEDGINFIDSNGDFQEQRKESLIKFLDLKSKVEDWNNFPKYMYNYINSKYTSPEEETEAVFGWYYYYLNELSHYCLEAIFWGILEELETKPYYIQQFIKVITQKVVHDCSENYEINPKTKLEDIVKLTKKEDVFDFIDRIKVDVKSREFINGISDAILGIIVLFNNNKNHLTDIQNYIENHFLQGKNGNVLQLFNKYITNNYHLSFKEFVEKTIQTILNDHMAIAYNKMGNSDRNLLKFIVEDNRLIHIETMQPNFTTPRLKTMHNFLTDLQLLTEDGKISKSGNNLLNKLNVA